MGLETFTGKISDLVDTNPTGTDPKSEGDDHIRGVKKTIRLSFPARQPIIGESNTPANNFTLTAAADNGTMKLARGNAGVTTQDVVVVAADGKVTFPQNDKTAPGTVAASCAVSVSGGVPTVNSAYNVGVVGRPSVGNFNVTLSPAMPDTKFAVAVTAGNITSAVIATVASVTTSNVALAFYDFAGVIGDPSSFSVIVTRQP